VSGLRTLTPLRVLVAVQIAALVATGLLVAFSFSHFTSDEAAHYSYVQSLAEDQRIPLLPDALISPQAEAIYEQTYPAPGRLDPATRGLGGQSYEGFQPPLYYGVAALPFAATPGGYLTKLRVLRLLGVAALLACAWLLWRLARRVAEEGDEDPLPLYAFALTTLLWPAVVVRTVTASNATLEMVLGLAIALAAWEAWTRRSWRWLLAGALLLGLGMLTRLTLVAFAPTLALAGWVALRRGGLPAARQALAAAAAVAIPALLLLPWLLYNLSHYDALSAWDVVKRMQEHVLNPRLEQWDAGDLPHRLTVLARGVVAEEWWIEYLTAWKRIAADVLGALFVGVTLWGGGRLPSPRRGKAFAVLALPVAGGLAIMTWFLLVGNWDFFLPRYLYPELAAFGLLTALALRRLLGRDGRLAGVAAAVTVALGVLWLHLTTVTPFTG
jgi:4-amino-4-deoxy-L-arabinose transferase-like glycosyltransferase